MMGYRSKKEIAEEFPVAVTLRFRSEDAKRNFMSQLSDGWGENYVELHWPWRDGVQFHDTDLFGVENMGDDDDEPTELPGTDTNSHNKEK